MGYYSGFLPSGAGQTGAGPSILSSIATGLETFLPVLFGRGAAATPPTFGGVPVRAPTPTIEAPVPVGTTVGQTPQSHPVLTRIGPIVGAVAGVGAATMGGVALQHMMGGGARARYAPAGTRGYHMIKKGPHAGLWTRNRHRNVANIRALRRALSRAHGFERICRKVMHFCSPHKSRGRAVFKRRGGRRK